MLNIYRFTGSILASGVARGGENYKSDVSWRLIIWIQLLFGVVILIAAFFLPESPRWLYVNNKQEQAKAMLVKYHGEDNPDSEWVNLQLNEYEELLEMDGADKRWWDYSALFKNRSTCYRLFCNCCITIFGQWAGNCKIASHYMMYLTNEPKLFYHTSCPKSSTQSVFVVASVKPTSFSSITVNNFSSLFSVPIL